MTDHGSGTVTVTVTVTMTVTVTGRGGWQRGTVSQRTLEGVLATLGDLIEDVVVRLDEPINPATDTQATIVRRRGGSAANVAAVAASIGGPARFLGQVGEDAIGTALLADLSGGDPTDAVPADAVRSGADLTSGRVDVSFVHRSGTTGTIVVLVDERGERTMLTDRRTCADLTDPDPAWLDGVSVLHLPLYSLIGGATSGTARTVAGWARERGVPVSVDLSSSALIESTGVAVVRDLLASIEPMVVFANADEASSFGVDGAIGNATIGDAVTVVKHGGDPAVIHRPGSPRLDVPAVPLDHLADSTGAGDAFAAGFLSWTGWSDDPSRACGAGHRAAHAHLTARH